MSNGFDENDVAYAKETVCGLVLYHTTLKRVETNSLNAVIIAPTEKELIEKFAEWEGAKLHSCGEGKYSYSGISGGHYSDNIATSTYLVVPYLGERIPESGSTINEISLEYIRANETKQRHLNEIAFREYRKKIAENIFQNCDMGDDEIADSNGWQYFEPGTKMWRQLFFENPNGGSSVLGEFTVYFKDINSLEVDTFELKKY